MIAAGLLLTSAIMLAESGPAPVRLPVPIVQQSRERCGPAALEMVLRFWNAPDSAVAHAAGAYNPVLKGALITDLAKAGRRAGYAADIQELDADALIRLIEDGVPPIVLYDVGFGPLQKLHYAVVVGWDPERARFTLHDGRDKPRIMSRRSLEKRRASAGSRTLIVRVGAP